eukprot:TRINITY_DN86847_c0_g1_i1.p2 TRINITY_DN86847_c0_g1~~TRINITY_DN86847_c0_g1_i1.p2  ORF type:complete len:174 (+),score=28.81 TRINITY_DN86847_c0_g1_i1:59-580(+)
MGESCSTNKAAINNGELFPRIPLTCSKDDPGCGYAVSAASRNHEIERPMQMASSSDLRTHRINEWTRPPEDRQMDFEGFLAECTHSLSVADDVARVGQHVADTADGNQIITATKGLNLISLPDHVEFLDDHRVPDAYTSRGNCGEQEQVITLHKGQGVSALPVESSRKSSGTG